MRKTVAEKKATYYNENEFSKKIKIKIKFAVFQLAFFHKVQFKYFVDWLTNWKFHFVILIKSF